MGVQTVTRPRSGTATVIDSPARAKALAEYLLDPERATPVVVVTTATGHLGPSIDAEAILDAVRENAEVYVLPTGDITFAMSHLLPPKTQVYGGAGRVYPVDPRWQSDPYAAPLRFAFGAAQGPGATDRLIADALGAVSLVDPRPKSVDVPIEHIEGEVKALIAPSGAWIQMDDGRHAVIWQDLLRSGVPLERMFRVGMRITGVLAVEESRIDVSTSERSPGDALVDYVVGTVVLGRVVEVDDVAAVVELYPGMHTGITAREVTGNPDDRLTTLLSVDEVLPVRVTSRGGPNGRGWRLSTVDVEGFEEVLASPSVLPDGPPWLVRAGAPAETSSVSTMSTAPLQIDRTERTERTEQIELLDAFQFERDGFREQASESYARVKQLDRSVEKARTELRIEKQRSQRLERAVRSANAVAHPVEDLDRRYGVAVTW